MKFINWIISALVEIEDMFMELYFDAIDIPVVGRYISYSFRELAYLCSDLAWDFYRFGEWADDVTDQLRDILSWSTIRSYIRQWVPELETIISWWYARFEWVSQIIDNWWLATKRTVQGWIDIATQGFDNLVVAWDKFWKITFPAWTTELARVGSELSNFFKYTLPTLFSLSYAEEWWRSKFLDVTGAILSAFTEREGFWAGWQDWRDKVTEFFTDPSGWIKSHVIEPIVDDFNRGFDRGMKGGGK